MEDGMRLASPEGREGEVAIRTGDEVGDES